MLNSIKNGYYATTAAVPVVKGSGIGNRRANKRQRAALAAAILASDVGFKPTRGQLATLLGVNVGYIDVARLLSPAKRKAIISGADVTSFPALLNGPKAPLALPAPKFVSDATLKETIRIAGIERTLNAAVAVETHAA